MPPISYVNGRYLPHRQATVHIEDRGYQFADGVYEVIAIHNNVLVDGEPHLDRLERSLAALSIPLPASHAVLRQIIRELLRRNRMRDGCLYLQITRGTARRDHPFPKQAKPSLVMTVSPPKTPSPVAKEKGWQIITHPDLRWGRRDIKSIALLPNILAKQKAVEAGVKEAWLVENGHITEGSSTNAYILSPEGSIITHPANERILGGVTRETVLSLARQNGLSVIERPFTVEEAKAAREAFVTSTTLGVMPVVQIDETVIGNGFPGELARRLMRLYEAYVAEAATP